MSDIKKNKDCTAGYHNFVVSHWVFNQTTQKANSYTCTRCLLSIDGNAAVQQAKADVHGEANQINS